MGELPNMQFTDARRNRVWKLQPGRVRNILYIVLLTPAGYVQDPRPIHPLNVSIPIISTLEITLLPQR
jgi:hypothetical protein